MSYEHLKICPEAAAVFGPEDFCPFTGQLLLTLWRGLAEFVLMEMSFCPFCGASLETERKRRRRALPALKIGDCSPAVRRALEG